MASTLLLRLCLCSCRQRGRRVMGLSKRVSSWSVGEVLEWLQERYPGHASSLQKGVIKHAISGGVDVARRRVGREAACLGHRSCENHPAGRALLRLKDRHLDFLGLEAEEQQRDLLQGLLLLRVQEEICELSEICSGENVTGLLCRL